jgi:hypothetical protein
MIYEPIPLWDNTVYMCQSKCETGSEYINEKDKIILYLWDKIKGSENLKD